MVELDGVPLPAAGSNLRLEASSSSLRPGKTLLPSSKLHLTIFISVQGLDTAEPRLHLQDGTVLVGVFEETVGTQMVFRGQFSIVNDANWPVLLHFLHH